LRREIEGQGDSLLDVGCGFNSPVRCLTRRPQRIVGVEGHLPALEQSRAAGIHDEYLCAGVLELDRHFAARSFDFVLASDLIEHLTEADGLKLISQMENIARKKVLIYTPNGFLPQGEEFDNPLQRHISGWRAEQMQALGYRVIGIEGLKGLRGEMAKIRRRPRRFWLMVSLLSQLFTASRPRWAFRILCIKDLEKGRTHRLQP
jgi:SAM-dependent methyltransferase